MRLRRWRAVADSDSYFENQKDDPARCCNREHALISTDINSDRCSETAAEARLDTFSDTLL
jgi:hypothetical protein